MYSPLVEQVVASARRLRPVPFPSYDVIVVRDDPYQLIAWWDHGAIITVVYHLFSGFLVWGRVHRPRRVPRVSWRAHKEWCMSFLQKLRFETREKSKLAANEIGDYFSAYPAIVDHLICCAYPGEPAEPRETSTLLLFAEEGLWKVMLRDRDSEATLWATGDTPEGAMSVLEGLLRLPTPPWRQQKNGSTTRRRR